MQLRSQQEITFVKDVDGWFMAIPEKFAAIIGTERLQEAYAKVFGNRSPPSVRRFGSSWRVNVTGAPKDKIQEFVTLLEEDSFGSR